MRKWEKTNVFLKYLLHCTFFNIIKLYIIFINMQFVLKKFPLNICRKLQTVKVTNE